MKKLLFVMAAAVIAATALEATAAVDETETPGVTAQQHRQMRRIRHGVRSGELTKNEAKELVKDQKSVRQMKLDAKADGVVTAEERRALHQALKAESRKIQEEKQDTETR